ncbi:MAG: pyridoxamine 5'-phosphate oxidase family protein [Planctomycetes bacterium]|nr:pyridoxamine 5'-phosphate oxidase family protein [Planctomycetota bacterium]
MNLPGSDGERLLQERFGTARRAARFYDNQVLDYLNEVMIEYLGRQELMFIATSDAGGNCDCSIRAGRPGFVRALDPRTMVYPEYRGNGVMASLGNISENPHVGVVFADLTHAAVGLHVNGTARFIENHLLLDEFPLPYDVFEETHRLGPTRPERWVCIDVHEAYIHCSKHIPLMQKLDKAIHWGTDDERAKGGDYFGVKGSKSCAGRST